MSAKIIWSVLLFISLNSLAQARTNEDPLEISTAEGAEILVFYGLETYARPDSIGTRAHIEEIFINSFKVNSSPKAYVFLNGRPFLMDCDGGFCHLKADPTAQKPSLYSHDILKILDSGKEHKGKIELEIELNGNLRLTDPKTGAKVFKLELKNRAFSLAG